MSNQADNPSSLGEFLRLEREKRGITIEQVASATKINVRLLHSLEENRFSELPAKPFIRGFVTSYARYIQLDPQEILTQYQDYLDAQTGTPASTEARGPSFGNEKKEVRKTRTALTLLLGGCILAGGLIIFIVKPAFKHAEEDPLARLKNLPAPTQSSEVVALESPAPEGEPSQSPLPSASASPQATPSASASASASPSPSPQAEEVEERPSYEIASKPDPLNSGINYIPSAVKYKFIFKALEDVWVRYQVDEKPMMKFPLRKDRVLVLRGVNVIRFQASNPNSLTYRLNGSPSKTLANEKALTLRQNTSTLVWPPQAIDSIGEIFPREGALPKTADPKQPAASPSPSPISELSTENP